MDERTPGMGETRQGERRRFPRVRGGRRDSDRPLELGDVIMKYRLAAGLTQQEAAGLADVTADQWSLWERGSNRPQRERIPRLAEVLDLAPEVLLKVGGYKPRSDSEPAPRDRCAEAFAPLVELLAERAGINELRHRITMLEEEVRGLKSGRNNK